MSDTGPRHSEKTDPDPHLSEKSDPDRSKRTDLDAKTDPDPNQNEKLNPNPKHCLPKKSTGNFVITNCCITNCCKMKSWIRIRNTAYLKNQQGILSLLTVAFIYRKECRTIQKLSVPPPPLDKNSLLFFTDFKIVRPTSTRSVPKSFDHTAICSGAQLLGKVAHFFLSSKK
jgi:hypothetical protein